MVQIWLFGIAYAQTAGPSDEDFNLLTILSIIFGLFFIGASFFFQRRLDAKLKEKLNNTYKIDEKKLKQPVETFNVESYVSEEPKSQ